jgi:hypothetical protein
MKVGKRLILDVANLAACPENQVTLLESAIKEL